VSQNFQKPPKDRKPRAAPEISQVPQKNESVRKHELRVAAAKLFLKVGYDRATVRDIAKKVGLQSGSIFYHFKTKEDILVDVMSEGLRQFAEAVNQPLRDASSPLEKLRGLFLGHLKALLNPDNSEIAVVLSEWRQLSPRSRRLVVKLRDEVDDVWNEVLREAAAQGLVQGDLRILRLSMLGAINWSLQWYDRRGKLTIEELASRLLETFVPPDRIPK
jgi:AcrR family transcriptional regulator